MAKATKKRAKKPPAKAPGFSPKAAKPDSEPVVITDLTASRCPFCQSTNREPYHGTQIIKGPVGIGRTTYARVELKRTRCTDCERRRIDRFKIPLTEDSPEPGE